MRLEHEFTIPVPVDQAWPVLLDIERIAPCMPGASLDTVDGDSFTGSVKVKLGPINLTYKGQASFTEKNDDTHTAVIDARGRDARGNGTAAAVITASLAAAGDETTVKVATDLNITGKPAQFGRGVMVDVGNKLIGQFADCLAGKLGQSDDDRAADDAAAATPAHGTAPTSGTPATEAHSDHPGHAAETVKPLTGNTSNGSTARPQAQEAEPIDLLELAGGSVAKRAVPAVGVLALIALLVVVLRRRSS